MTRLSVSLFFLYALFSLESYGEPLPETPPTLTPVQSERSLPGTALLETTVDLSRRLVDGNDRFLDKELAQQRRRRSTYWSRDPSGPIAYEVSIARNRANLRGILGLDRDPGDGSYDSEKEGITIQSRTGEPLTVFSSLTTAGSITVNEVIWPVFGGIQGRGILLEPERFDCNVIAIPDSTEWAGEITDGITFTCGVTLARNGARVFIPSRITRDETQFTLTNREWLHRPAFVLGRTLLGYELHKLFALHDGITDQEGKPWKVLGWGDGGMLALYAGATNTDFQSVFVSGYFGNREELWKEPFDHQLFGLLTEFGDADIASLIAPRKVILEHSPGPEFHYRSDAMTNQLDRRTEYTKRKGKPGFFRQQSREEFDVECRTLSALFDESWKPELHICDSKNHPFSLIGLNEFLNDPGPTPISFDRMENPGITIETNINSSILQNRERLEIEAHLQSCLIESSLVRTNRFKNVDTDSLENFKTTIESFREEFRKKVIGEFDFELEKPESRSRLAFESEKTESYEITIPVYEDLFAYGILTLPKTLPLDGSIRRPVVVCQHGLEGSPHDLIGEQKFKAYRAFATRLAEEGFITFAPQNGYKYFDHFRLQQFKAQSMGKSLFSLMVPKHEQITKWLAEQPYVDGENIAFYGLSYGGKSAMRIPPLLDKYALSICSGDFNEWVWKNAATDPESLRYSYANKGEYEIFEWNLGGTFNYAEMAALICPRPFMVERGHFDGVAPDEKVAHEYAKVRNLYEAKLGIGDHCEIEWFAGPHRIHGNRTLDFLKKHLGL